MKIGILTQSMAANYGCNLQAYALQTVLERSGHQVEILDRWDEEIKLPIIRYIYVRIKRALKDVIKLCVGKPVYHTIEKKDTHYFWKNILEFQNEYLHKSRKLYSTQELSSYIESNKFDAYIVGSDQVWRPAYNLGDKLYDMYLKFTKGQNVYRLSYAASFGLDSWEYTPEQTKICAMLAQQFNAISVRERSGVDLCKKHLGVDATHVLDPTLLLEKSDYVALIEKRKVANVSGNLFCYILDKSPEIHKCIEYTEKTLSMHAFTYLNPCPEGTYRLFHKSESIFPSIEQWLMGFRDAEMVLVDSFHGTVFSIIFNKPFWVVGNNKRGMARFKSLLSLFDLEDRLISADQIHSIDLSKPVDWSVVNQKWHALRKVSLDYLNGITTHENRTN